ncbi:unnamed protein product, partial [Pylaiella littoralis]
MNHAERDFCSSGVRWTYSSPSQMRTSWSTCVPMEKVAGMGMPSGVLGPQSWVEFAERTAKRVGIMSYVLWTCGVVLLEHVMGNVSVGLAVALQPL